MSDAGVVQQDRTDPFSLSFWDDDDVNSQWVGQRLCQTNTTKHYGTRTHHTSLYKFVRRWLEDLDLVEEIRERRQLVEAWLSKTEGWTAGKSRLLSFEVSGRTEKAERYRSERNMAEQDRAKTRDAQPRVEEEGDRSHLRRTGAPIRHAVDVFIIITTPTTTILDDHLQEAGRPSLIELPHVRPVAGSVWSRRIEHDGTGRRGRPSRKSDCRRLSSPSARLLRLLLLLHSSSPNSSPLNRLSTPAHSSRKPHGKVRMRGGLAKGSTCQRDLAAHLSWSGYQSWAWRTVSGPVRPRVQVLCIEIRDCHQVSRERHLFRAS